MNIEDFKYEVIAEPARARKILKSFKASDKFAIDFETTSLHPNSGYVRITTIYNDKVSYVFDHHFCGSFEKLVPIMIGPTYICFHAKFELLWFAWFGYEDVKLWDVAFMRKAVQGGGGYGLAQIADWDLDIKVDKSLQTSNWSSDNLTKDQYMYAGWDGYVTWELFKHWAGRMNEGHWGGFHVLNDSVMAILECEATGIYLDIKVHERNINLWKLKQQTALRYFRRFTPEGVIANVNSNKQMSDFLKRELAPDTIAKWPTTAKTPHLLMDQDTCKAVAKRLPYPMNRWLAAFIMYRYYTKYLNTYGDKLITKQRNQNKVTYKLNIAAAVTCRMSSSGENIQNMPRKPYIREAFAVRPWKVERMVLADYSGIEVRVAAEISGDKKLLHDASYGDVHSVGASIAQGIDFDYFVEVLHDKKHKNSMLYKGYRQKAKIATFRLLYGAGVGAISDSLNMNDDDGRNFVNGWAEQYPEAYNYRYKMFSLMQKDGYLSICDGRTIYVRKADRQLPVAANYPVQSAAGSVMYRAMYRVRELLVERELDASMIAPIHDELLLYSPEKQAGDTLEALEDGMTQGWLDIFPGSCTDNLLESAIGENWAAKP